VGLEFLQRVRRTSIITGLVIFAVITTYFDFPAGAAWSLGCAWSLVNLLFIGLFVKTLTAQNSRMRMVLIALVKVPVLYLIGFLLINTAYFPLPLLLAGFMWPLLVITLKGLGRLLLRLDSREALDRRMGMSPGRLHKN
jgi:hypothetical protein